MRTVSWGWGRAEVQPGSDFPNYGCKPDPGLSSIHPSFPRATLLCFREQPITANTFANAASLPALGQLAGPVPGARPGKGQGAWLGKGPEAPPPLLSCLHSLGHCLANSIAPSDSFQG